MYLYFLCVLVSFFFFSYEISAVEIWRDCNNASDSSVRRICWDLGGRAAIINCCCILIRSKRARRKNRDTARALRTHKFRNDLQPRDFNVTASYA